MNVQDSKLFRGYPQYLITIPLKKKKISDHYHKQRDKRAYEVCVCENNAKELNRNRCVTY